MAKDNSVKLMNMTRELKICTDLNQSRRLSKKLPWTSADAYYINGDPDKLTLGRWTTDEHDDDDVPAWSLSALYLILPVGTTILKQHCPGNEFTNSAYSAECVTDGGYKMSTALYYDPLNALCELVARLKPFELEFDPALYGKIKKTNNKEL